MIQLNPSRRRLLLLGATVGGAVVAASQWNWLRLASGPRHLANWSDGKRLLVLTPSEAQLIEHLGDAVLPCGTVSSTGFTWPTMQEAHVVRRLDEELYFIAEQIRSDFKLALKVVNVLPLLYGDTAFFSSLPRTGQQACLRASENTRIDAIRAAVNACRMGVTLQYFGNTASWPSMAYDGTFSKLPQQLSSQRLHYKKLTETPT